MRCYTHLMAELRAFVVAVGSHWAAWGTGGLLVFIIAALDQAYNWKIPKPAYLVFLVVGLFVAFFQAWRDQYRENEAGRTIGSITLERVEFFGAMASPTIRKADVQLTLVLKNIQPRLVECHVDKIDAQIQGKHPGDEYINKGGYIYAGREISLQLPFIKDTDILPTILGQIEYNISYQIVGSGIKHHTTKKLAIRAFPGQKTDYSVLTESEN